MKAILIFAGFAFAAGSAFAQSIEKPYVESVDDRLCYINKIETNKNFTIVTFAHQNNKSKVNLNPGIYLEGPDDTRYAFVKAEGIPLAREWYTFKENEADLPFKIYFKPLPKSAKTINIHETEPNRGSFNYYGVSLERKRSTDVQKPHFDEYPVITEHITAGTPPIPGEMGPMLNSIMQSVMDSAVSFYSQPGKLSELAKLNKMYYDALIKEGFSADQAMQLLLAGPMSKTMNAGK